MINKKKNLPAMILLILGLSAIALPLYMTIVIAFKQPTEMTNSIAGILSLPQTWSLHNFKEAMRVTDFWHSLGNSLMITIVTVGLSLVIHSLMGYALARNRKESKFYNFVYLFIVSGMFVPFAQLNFQSQFGTNYNLAFASYLLSLVPILIFYLICQKQILDGVVNGAVK